MRMYGSRQRGGAVGYTVVALLAAVLGGAGVWMAAERGALRPGGQYLAESPPYTVAPVAAGRGGVDARATGDAIVAAVARVAPAVVNIDITMKPKQPEIPEALRRFLGPDLLPEPEPTRGEGSGMIIDARRGLVLTNAHVVQNASSIRVSLPDKREFIGKVLGTDPYGDVALVRIPGGNLPTVTLASTANVPIGSWAIAIGNPLGFKSSVTLGVVSATERVLAAPNGIPLENLVQTDAAINPGNSGGPLCDINGDVIAMNTAIIPSAQGIGFAVGIDSVRKSVDDLLRYGKVIRPYIGILYTEITSDIQQQLHLTTRQGVVILQVQPGSPAAAAGLMAGDVVQSVDGRRISNTDDLRRIVRGHRVGDTVTLGIIRGGRSQSIRVKIAQMPPPPPSSSE